MHTKDRLSETLGKVGLIGLSLRAQNGEFDDFLSPHMNPQMVLADELFQIGNAIKHIREDLINGEYDSTNEESEAWAKSGEGQDALRRLYQGK